MRGVASHEVSAVRRGQKKISRNLETHTHAQTLNTVRKILRISGPLICYPLSIAKRSLINESFPQKIVFFFFFQWKKQTARITECRLRGASKQMKPFSKF